MKPFPPATTVLALGLLLGGCTPTPRIQVMTRQADERAQAFWRGFQRLSARDREILGLRHFQELSYAQIARRLAIPEGTVMSRLFHARARLRTALSGSFDEVGEREEHGR